MVRAPAKRSRARRAPAAPAACASAVGAEAAALAADVEQLEVRPQPSPVKVQQECRVPDTEGVGGSQAGGSQAGLRISRA